MKLRAVVMGKNRVAVECFKILCGHKNAQVVLAVAIPADNGQDGWQPSLAKAAGAHRVPVITPEKINSAEIVQKLKILIPDFIFSFQYDFILKEPLLGVPHKGAINLHFGPLPRYRGVSTIAWQIMNGEEETGVTLHYIDPGVDSGDLIAMNRFKIDPKDTAKSLYEKCTDNAVRLFKENLDAILSSTNTRTPQDLKKILYYPKGSIDFSKSDICWDRDSKNLFNWIRSFIFPPFQLPRTTYHGRPFDILNVNPDKRIGVGRSAGTVLDVGDGICVATRDGSILIEKVCLDKKEMLAGKLAETLNIRTGDSLGE